LQTIERAIPEDGVVVIDAGNTGAHAVHYLRSPRHGHWLVAMGMAGMGYTFGAAIGAAFSSGRRTLVLAGDGAFFMHGLEIHTAVQHQLPITYVIFNNNAHGMCRVRERLLLGQESGYNVFGDSQIGEGLAAIFPGLRASDCSSLQEVEQALASAGDGPVVICADLPGIEIPPFAAFKAALAARTTTERGAPRT
jgi:acetolactate synthase-1/2/3 large subunit